MFASTNDVWRRRWTRYLLFALMGVGGMAEASPVQDAAAVGTLARILYEEGRLDRAILEYQAAIRLAPTEVRLYLELADVFETANLNDEAITLLDGTVDAFPRSIPALVRLGEAEFRAGELESALRTFKRARSVSEAGPGESIPLDTRVLIERRIGDMHVHLIEFDEALGAYERALALDPVNVDVHLALGKLYLRRNRLDDAVEAYSVVIRSAPEEPSAYHGLAEAELRRGRFHDSVAAADAALELDPRHLGAMYVRATALVRSGQADAGAEALAAYRVLEEEFRIQDHREREIGGAYKQAIALSLEGNGDDAVQVLRDALALYPDSRELHLNLGSVLSSLGRDAEATEVFRRMVDMGWGDDPLVRRNLDEQSRAGRAVPDDARER